MSITTKNSGFSLIESIITIAIGSFVAAMILITVTPGLDYIREAKRMEYLHENALFLTNTLNSWIKQGVYLEVPSPSSLSIVLADSTIKEIERDGDNINIDSTPFNDSKVKITDLNFIEMPHSVRVNFTLKSHDSDESLSIQTTIAKRNIP